MGPVGPADGINMTNKDLLMRYNYYKFTSQWLVLINYPILNSPIAFVSQNQYCLSFLFSDYLPVYTTDTMMYFDLFVLLGAATMMV